MEVITKSDAIERGLNFYFTGKPCKRGHIAKRYMNGGCSSCMREAQIKHQNQGSKGQGRPIRISTGMFANLHMVHLPRKVAQERNIKTYLPVGACIRGHWVPRTTGVQYCPLCSLSSYDKDPRGYILKRVRGTAKQRGLPFNLTIEDIEIPSKCPLLGIPIKAKSGAGLGSGRGKKEDINHGASVDRINPDKGYVKGNIWIISNKANRMKQDLSIEQLRFFADQLEQKMKEVAV
ncbi:hypothetical protein J9100_002470 [Vibrio vulnificus]|nr:hypothetical protein [Vibrio vulnificus]